MPAKQRTAELSARIRSQKTKFKVWGCFCWDRGKTEWQTGSFQKPDNINKESKAVGTEANEEYVSWLERLAASQLQPEHRAHWRANPIHQSWGLKKINKKEQKSEFLYEIYTFLSLKTDLQICMLCHSQINTLWVKWGLQVGQDKNPISQKTRLRRWVRDRLWKGKNEVINVFCFSRWWRCYPDILLDILLPTCMSEPTVYFKCVYLTVCQMYLDKALFKS